MEDWFPETMRSLLALQPPDAERMQMAFRSITDAAVDEVRAAAFLTALQSYENFADVSYASNAIASAAMVLREKMVPFDCRGREAIDTCGTGGDHTGTFNISTAVAFVVAGAGLAVVKHGNRSVSSKSGSADVLEVMGVPVEAGPAWSQRCFDEFGIAFCYAPHFHPALKNIAAVRRKLGFRTIFNLLGPMLNPGCVPYQVVGVGAKKLVSLLGLASTKLNLKRSWLVHGLDGLDEFTLGNSTLCQSIEGDRVGTLCEVAPEDFGLGFVDKSELRIETAVESAAIIRRVLAGEDIPHARIVLANAAAAFVVANRAETLSNGVELARDSIASGRAADLLSRLRSST